MSSRGSASVVLRRIDDPGHLTQMAIKEIIDKFDVDQRTAYELRRLVTAETMSSGATESVQTLVLKVLKNGVVDGIPDLQDAIMFLGHKVTAMDVTKAVWSLQKRNLVTFYERKHGGDSILTKIKLNRNGMAEMGITKRDDTKPPRVQPSRELKRPSPVGTDYTDAKNHSHRANGGPVVKIGHVDRPKPESAGPIEYTAPPVPEPARYTKPEPLPQNMKAFIDEAPATQKSREDIGSTSTTASADTHTQYPDLADFPIMASLRQKQERYERTLAAAELLIGVDDEMANKLIESAVKLTDLELEVVRFLSR